jgi:hypothetical protein
MVKEAGMKRKKIVHTTVRRKGFRVPASVKAWVWAGSVVAAFILGVELMSK